MSRAAHFLLIDPAVVSISASWEGSDEPHTNWFIGYAPELEEDTNLRVLMGTLHVVGKYGRGDIRVGALLRDEFQKGFDQEEFEDALEGSEILEILYDFARVSLRSVLGIVDSDAIVPVKSPAPEIDQLIPVDTDDAATAD